ncbi:hypothetical protein Pla123a_34120 [Posidoniimonas polymericola]|uniref:Thioredoxin domain-containing protein n=1 Tax=Posidoniimonas polymericola TaxID=2528002 RepID=A0A5C5YI93_9BACT|nr:nitrophenyl compound nitroreductase subunit ArsF family protein [Posidoniimonas polymericola]TWT74588.1 hypothetical protein Pla123a_34120 [Posidoniimonas polymericola]
MTAKKLVASGLLLFAAASVVVLVGREVRAPTADDAARMTEQLPDNGLVVYYFHGDTRCHTCRNIEGYAYEAVQAAFADELAEDQLQWKVVNYEQPENSHFVTEYDIVAPTVVLVRTANRERAEWRNLDRVWELVDDHGGFTEYVQSEARSMLGL